jgi:2-amino-4-hydroxy-6-hydroxymethyldihydropteridine diphosphokinase
MKYFLSLGSNLGKKRQNLARALDSLEQAKVRVLHASSIYRTQPVDHADQPWFYNQVVEVRTSVNPYELLALIKRVEKELGRIPARKKGPRTIDIDILMAENWVMATKRLVIPHPRMTRRKFVLVPLKEIAPTAVHPCLKEKTVDLWKKSRDTSIVRKLPTISSQSRRKA